MRPPLAAALGGVAALLCGCAELPAADRGPRGDPVARLAPSTPSPWRQDFGDPVLRDLLARADARALDVKLALARLERARADVEAADAVRKVNVVAGVDSAFGGHDFHSRRAAAVPALEVTQELDLWGRLASARGAARSDLGAAASDAAAARLLVASQTVRAYLALRAAQAAEAAASERLHIAEKGAELLDLRLSQGAATAPEAAARRAAVRTTADLMRQAADTVVLQTARLSDLTGGEAPLAPADHPLGLPSALGSIASNIVDARPDVQAARDRLAAADQRRAAAIAATRPQFQIAAALGAPDAAIATLLDIRALAWAVAANVSHEVLDGGARRAKVHAATADADIADIAYRQTVLNAWSDVRDALAEDAQARRDLAAAAAELAAARAALATGEAKHASGAADGLAMVALRDSVEQAAQVERGARFRVADAAVRIALATGGG